MSTAIAARSKSASRSLLRGLAFVAWLAAIVLFAATALADEPSKADKKRAKELFDQGIALSDDGKWADALAIFEKSDKLNPSLGVRYNIGATLRALGRYVEARKVLKHILKEGPEWQPPLKASLKKDVEKLLEEVEGKIVVVKLDVDPSDATVQIDGADAKIKDGAVEVDPGKHVFEVSADGYETSTVTRNITKPTTVDLVAKKIAVIEKRVEVPAERPIYARGWFLGTAGAVVATTVVVILAVALKPKAPPPASAPSSSSGMTIPARFTPFGGVSMRF